MIRKSAWLLSAGLFAVATPAFAETSVSNDTGQQPAQPAPGATQDAAAQNQAAPPVGEGEIVITATRRNQALSNVPMAVSAVTAQQLQYT
ncbi:MAG TPA: hypothetical protein VK192_01280, partial [Sphingomicrobium sp.]|nr:hypothetical protein [Sphingomicrobium sp.]